MVSIYPTKSTDRVLLCTFRRVIPLLAGLALALLTATSVLAQILSVPVRWCAVEGSPAAETPEIFNDPFLDEPTTDHTLWRRHERATDKIYLPQAEITFRSAVWNIVAANDLSFPVIADPCNPNDDPTCPGSEGDILIPSEGTDEWNALYNECVNRWDMDLGDQNTGIVMINVRKIVNSAGDRAIGGWATSAVEDDTGEDSPLSIMIEDYAFRSPGATTPDVSGGLNSWDDQVGYLVGHELGHRLTLGHTCDGNNPDQDNLMNWQGLDRTEALGNFEMLTSIDELLNGGSTDCTGATQDVDQIAEARAAAALVDGCTVDGTNDPCSVLSDASVDRVRDVPVVSLDMSLVTIAELENGLTRFSHRLFNPFSGLDIEAFDTLDYFYLIDADNDNTTGGAPANIDVPTEFQGAELVTRVRVSDSATFAVPIATVWRFENGAFSELSHASITARVRGVREHGDEPTPGLDLGNLSAITSHIISLRLSTALRGDLDTPFRVQAITRGLAEGQRPVIDRLDDSEGEPGVKQWLVHPTFPTCNVEPVTAMAGTAAVVHIDGLLPQRGAHVVFGDRTVSNGVVDASGTASIAFLVPKDARAGLHLVTVGSDETALTADCVMTVSRKPPSKSDRDRRFKLLISYEALLKGQQNLLMRFGEVIVQLAKTDNTPEPVLTALAESFERRLKAQARLVEDFRRIATHYPQGLRDK